MLARIGVRPLGLQQGLGGVWRVLQRVVVLRPSAAFDLRDLGADGDHGVAEAVEFGPRFAFRRLHHQRAGHREAERGRVEAVVDQALGDVFGADAAAVLERPQIQDAFVGDAAALDLRIATAVKHGVVVSQPGSDVVGAEDGDFSGVAQAVGAHHAAVHPADRQHAGVAQWRGTDGAHRLRPAHTGRAVRGQERHQVGHHRHRPHAGAAATVRDAEGLVQIEVAHVAAEFTGCGHAHQRVHIGAVHIDTAAVLVHQRAEFLHAHFEHAVRAGVGDHHRGQVGAVLFALRLEVVHVDVAHRIALGHHDGHARHLRAGRVGAVRTFWNQADVSPAFAARLVEGLDDQQPRVLTLAAGVGLQADAGITRGLGQPGAQLVVHGPVAGELVARRKGMHVRKLGPGDGDHLAGGVELHGAAAERDHAAVQRQVLVAQGPDVAQHFGFAVMAVEHRVPEVAARATQRLGDHRFDALLEGHHVGQRLAGLGEKLPQRADVVARGGFVQRDAGHGVAPFREAAQVHAGGHGT